MAARRLRVALRAEDAVEPAVAHAVVRVGRHVGRSDERALELAQRDRLLLVGARDRIGLAGDVDLQLLGDGEQLEPVRIELRRLRPLEVAELLTVCVRIEHGETRLRGAQRQLLALEGHARADERVLERILLVG